MTPSGADRGLSAQGLTTIRRCSQAGVFHDIDPGCRVGVALSLIVFDPASAASSSASRLWLLSGAGSLEKLSQAHRYELLFTLSQ